MSRASALVASAFLHGCCCCGIGGNSPTPSRTSTPAPANGWTLYESVDAMTDEKTVAAKFEWEVDGWLSKPSILVRCRAKKLDVLYDFRETPTRNSLDAGFKPYAKFRWDEKSAINKTFDEAEGLGFTLFSRSPKDDTKALATHKRLRVQYTPVLDESRRDLDVKLVGDTSALATVAASCGVTL